MINVTERILTPKEAKRLDDLKLSPPAAKVVREVWESGPEIDGGNMFVSIASWFFTPALVTMFILSITNKQWVKLDNVAITATWLIFICTTLLLCLMQAAILKKDGEELLRPMPMSIWRKASTPMKVYSRTIMVALLVVLSYCGHILTTVVFFFIWIANLLMASTIRDKVQAVIDSIEKDAKSKNTSVIVIK